LQWLFNKGMDSSTGSQHIHGVISAAHDLVDVPTNRIADLVVAEVRNALPAAGNAGLLHVRVVKEKRATFSIEPGVDRFRPAARGAIGNLSLAGDWCRTGWPATMEGAVRSGYLAAAAALNDAGVKLEPDLTPAPMYLAIAGS
jgi:zeta-carotene desaturase